MKLNRRDALKNALAGLVGLPITSPNVGGAFPDPSMLQAVFDDSGEPFKGNYVPAYAYGIPIKADDVRDSLGLIRPND